MKIRKLLIWNRRKGIAQGFFGLLVKYLNEIMTEEKLRYFDVEAKNKAPHMGKGTISTFTMIDCKHKSLKELVLKIAEKCYENEDDDFISLTITQKLKK
jgi:hypothetical protein